MKECKYVYKSGELKGQHCHRKHVAKGYCGMHYARKQAGGNMDAPAAKTIVVKRPLAAKQSRPVHYPGERVAIPNPTLAKLYDKKNDFAKAMGATTAMKYDVWLLPQHSKVVEAIASLSGRSTQEILSRMVAQAFSNFVTSNT